MIKIELIDIYPACKIILNFNQYKVSEISPEQDPLVFIFQNANNESKTIEENIIVTNILTY